jgi:peroxiredoxin/GNAT superfamily N-acetyltransferase
MKTTDGPHGSKALADTVDSRKDLRLVEAAGQSAWPEFTSKNVHGWVWRNSGGGFGRSNSVFTLNFSGPDALEAVSEVEQLYREEGRRARIRVSDVSEPKGLRGVLFGRGYAVESAGLVMVKPARMCFTDHAGVEWSHFPTPYWQKVYQGVIDEPRRRTIGRLLAEVPRPHIFTCYRLHGLTLSIGLAVLVDGIATLECIATHAEARRRGGASKVLAGLEHWAFENGAHTLHLQVAEHNGPGAALYGRYGFERLGRFEYLVAPSGLVGPRDDGAAAHLVPGITLPSIRLLSVRGADHDANGSDHDGRTLVICYPWTGRPGLANPLEWDEILGAHGSTPELEGFRDRHADFVRLGASVIPVSSQSCDHQCELAERLRLPFDVLSDQEGRLSGAWRLPTFETGGATFLRRLTLIVDHGRIERVFYPVHPPERHAAEVLAWLEANPSSAN